VLSYLFLLFSLALFFFGSGVVRVVAGFEAGRVLLGFAEGLPEAGLDDGLLTFVF
jgi:hypothetical protein